MWTAHGPTKVDRALVSWGDVIQEPGAPGAGYNRSPVPQNR